jgi:hypothetical protein
MVLVEEMNHLLLEGMPKFRQEPDELLLEMHIEESKMTHRRDSEIHQRMGNIPRFERILDTAPCINDSKDLP